MLIAVSSVSGHLGCYDKILQAGWLIKDGSVFLTPWSRVAPRCWRWAGCRAGGAASRLIGGIVSLCPYVAGRAREFYGVCFAAAAKSLQSCPTLCDPITSYFQNPFFTCPWAQHYFQIPWLVSPHLPDLYSLKYSRASLFIYNHV